MIAGVQHQMTVGWDDDRTLFYISLIIAVIHLILFLYNMWKAPPEA